MRKYILISFISVFFLSLFIINADSVYALKPLGCTETSEYSTITGQSCSTGEGTYSSTYLPSCSSVSGYSLIKGQSCSVLVKTNTVFNFKAKDLDNNNLSWSIDWGDTQKISKKCPASSPNTAFSVGHAWDTAGTYNVKLGVSNCKADGDASASFDIVVTNPVVTLTNPSVDITDIIVFSQQDIPDKFLWTNAIRLPLKFIVSGTSIPDFTYSMSYADGQWTQPSFFPASFSWQPGERTLNVGFSTNKCGPHNIKITLNSDKKIPEKDYTNNTFEKTIEIDCTKAAYDFDMTIEKVGTWPTTSIQGKYVTLNAKIRNLGTQEDPRFSLLYSGYTKDPTKPGHGPVCLYRTDLTGTHEISCPAGSFSYVQDQPVCGNNHYVLKVDAFNDVLETNENNNEVSGDVFVDCDKKPDFVIEKVGTWPTTVKSGTKPIMYFVEKNIGQVSAGRAGTVRMMANNDYRGSAWEFINLSPGGSTSSMQFGYWYSGSQNPTTDYWNPICQSGEKITLKVCADNACGWGISQIDESDENNNILTHEVTCRE